MFYPMVQVTQGDDGLKFVIFLQDKNFDDLLLPESVKVLQKYVERLQEKIGDSSQMEDSSDSYSWSKRELVSGTYGVHRIVLKIPEPLAYFWLRALWELFWLRPTLSNCVEESQVPPIHKFSTEVEEELTRIFTRMVSKVEPPTVSKVEPPRLSMEARRDSAFNALNPASPSPPVETPNADGGEGPWADIRDILDLSTLAGTAKAKYRERFIELVLRTIFRDQKTDTLRDTLGVEQVDMEDIAGTTELRIFDKFRRQIDELREIDGQGVRYEEGHIREVIKWLEGEFLAALHSREDGDAQ